MNDHLVGTFSFSAGDLPDKNWIKSENITKNASEMLINALQGRDEFAELKQRFAESGETLIRAKVNFSWPAAAKPELEAVAKQIWEIAASAPVTISGLFQRCTVCELKIYQAIDELNRAFHDQPPSGFIQAPYLVTKDNIHAEGGDKNVFIPSNNYEQHYLEMWGIKQ